MHGHPSRLISPGRGDGLGALVRTGDRIVVTVGRVNRAAILEGVDGEVVLSASGTARVRVE